MSHHDDSEILTRLGILDSLEESPRKIEVLQKRSKKEPAQERERFVDVKIDGEGSDLETEDDEDDIFDKNTLLATSSRTRVSGRRKSESFACRYLLLLLTYFSIGIAFHSSPDVLSPSDRENHSLYLFHSIGILAGVFLGKFLVSRLNWTFTFFFFLSLLTMLSWLLLTMQESVNLIFAAVAQGIALGTLNYVGISVFFAIWRGHNRKLVLFLMFFAGGAVISIMSHKPEMGSPTTLAPEALSQPRDSLIFRRSANLSLLTTESGENENTTSVPRIKKPEVAQGIETIATKTQQNEENREKAIEAKANATLEEERMKNSSAALSSSSSTSTSTTTSTTSTTTPVPTSTPVPSTEVTEKGPSVPSTEVPSILSSPSLIPYYLDSYSEMLTVIMLTCATSFAVCGFICCCLSCRFGIDAKMKKLNDKSASRLTKGCRLRLAVFQLLLGCIDSITMMMAASEGVERLRVACGTVFVVRFLAVLIGPMMYSLPSLWILLISLLTAVISLNVFPFSSFLLLIIAGSIGILPIVTTLLIESRLSPRSSILIDYWLIPSAVGHLTSLSICHLMTSSTLGAGLSVSASLASLVFFLLSRSVLKAARLKEIMEYSSQPVPDEMGNYFSLLERDDESVDFDGQLSDVEGLVSTDAL